MKVLFVHSSLKRGGAERTIIHVSNHLTSHGYDVRVFLTAPASESVSYVLPEGVRMLSISPQCDQMRGYKRYLRVLAELRSTIRNEKADVVIGMNSSSAVDITLAAAFLGVKKIACERSNPYLSATGKVWHSLKRIFSVFMDGYIFQTERASLFYPKCVRRKMTIIPNMVEPVAGNLYAGDSKIVLAVGNLREVKGFDLLIRAFSQVDRQGYQLIVVGEGEQRVELEALIAEKNLTECVFLPGRTDQVSAYYRRASIFVLSSQHEGMPNCLMEAMSYGLPCVSTDCPMGPRELIQDGLNGLLVPVGEISEMTQAIDRLIHSEELRKKLSEEAFQINVTNCPEKIGAMWEAYCLRIIAAS